LDLVFHRKRPTYGDPRELTMSEQCPACVPCACHSRLALVVAPSNVATEQGRVCSKLNTSKDHSKFKGLAWGEKLPVCE
jgi:hypothetical protein